MNKNIFIVGDLMIDHTIFVARPRGHHQSAPGETVFDVDSRLDNAGGAANCARILAIVNDGRTYLWGILGKTNWGDFRSILKSSHEHDRAPRSVELRGVADETDATMNTITRLVLLNDDQTYTRTVRFDDTDHVHVTDEQRRQVMYHLNTINEKSPLDVIIINDLDKRTLNQNLVELIAEFASAENIPIIVDPKRTRNKYDQIQGLAVLPNLNEWCHLVEKPNDRDKFYDQLDNQKILNEMAQLSLRFLGNFRYHIITCDKKGSVLIVPDSNSRDRYAVYRAPAVYRGAMLVDSPLGCGDIVTAVFAGEYEKSLDNGNRSDSTQMVLNAFQVAHEVAGAYCKMPWHQMPSQVEIEQLSKERDLSWSERTLASPSEALRLLPREAAIDLRPYKTEIPHIYTKYQSLRDELARLVRDLREGTGHHFIVAAPSGFGKSLIINALPQILPETPISNITGNKLAALVKGDFSDIENLFKEHKSSHTSTPTDRIITVDEAQHGTLFHRGGQGKFLLEIVDMARKKGIRFIFIDSQFYNRKANDIDLVSDVVNRCEEYTLDGISLRPLDIPLLIGSVVLNSSDMAEYANAQISGEVLCEAMLQLLEDRNPRRTIKNIKKACERAQNRHEGILRPGDYPGPGVASQIPGELIAKFYLVTS